MMRRLCSRVAPVNLGRLPVWMLIAGVLAAVLNGAPADARGAACSPISPSAYHATPARSTPKAFRRADVWLYGDSITYQTYRDLRERSRARIAVDAWWGRGTASAVTALGRDAHRFGYRRGHWPRVVVMATGTNDLRDVAAFTQQVRLARAVLPARVRLVWVNVYVTTTPAFNAADAQLAAVPGVRVLSWAKANRESTTPLLVDGIHVNAAGCAVRNRLIRRATD